MSALRMRMQPWLTDLPDERGLVRTVDATGPPWGQFASFGWKALMPSAEHAVGAAGRSGRSFWLTKKDRVGVGYCAWPTPTLNVAFSSPRTNTLSCPRLEVDIDAARGLIQGKAALADPAAAAVGTHGHVGVDTTSRHRRRVRPVHEHELRVAVRIDDRQTPADARRVRGWRERRARRSLCRPSSARTGSGDG